MKANPDKCSFICKLMIEKELIGNSSCEKL